MLYPSMCLCSHSCSPNTQSLHKPNYAMELRFNDFKCIIKSNELVYFFSHRATKNIAKGEEITTTYTSLWESPVSRKKELYKNWFFTCKCERCLSGNDFGSNLDSWKCDCSGVIGPDKRDAWTCDKCRISLKTEDIESQHRAAVNELEVTHHKGSVSHNCSSRNCPASQRK